MVEDYKARILRSTILMSQEVNPVGLHSAVKHSDLDALWLLGLTGQTKRAWPRDSLIYITYAHEEIYSTFDIAMGCGELC